MDNHEQPVGKQWRWYTTTSGIWQTVFIEPRARVASSSTFASSRISITAPPVSRSIALHAGRSDASSAGNHLPPDGARCKSATLPSRERAWPKDRSGRSAVALGSQRAHLYASFCICARARQVVDTVRTYFGMRKIDFAPAGPTGSAGRPALEWRAALSARRALSILFIRMVFTPPAMSRPSRTTFVCAKKFGFNFLRIHIKMEIRCLLY